MGFENTEQLRELFLSGGMGFLLGLYYDAFRILRSWLRPSRFCIFLQDCAYALTSAVFTFLFVLALNGGVLRFYVLVGVLAGFFAYRYTVGRVIIHSVLWLIRKSEKMARHIEKQTSIWCEAFQKRIKTIFCRFYRQKNEKN